MRNLLLLLVVFVCGVAYMRAQQPSTWNSWMVALGTNDYKVGATSSSNAASATDPSAPAAAILPPPPRAIPVGGLIRNGTFTDGGQDWQGDGRSDPSGKGLIVTLSPSSWTRLYQVFPGDQRTQYSIEITYKLSPGTALSKNPSDYTGILKQCGLDGFESFGDFTSPPGSFFGTIGDPHSQSISLEYYQPQQGSTDVQDYQHTYPPVPPNGNMVFGLAFPPGSGSVTLLTAYVTSK